jgi:hypothetical protein
VLFIDVCGEEGVDELNEVLIFRPEKKSNVGCYIEKSPTYPFPGVSEKTTRVG